MNKSWELLSLIKANQMTKTRSYHELIQIESFGDRLSYLQLRDTKYLSPRDISNPFYKSSYWLALRKDIIRRDLGCDLGVWGVDIDGIIIVHHINPLLEFDLDNVTDKCLDPDNLITTSINTHNAIHYKNKVMLDERKPGDTKIW